MVGYIGNSIVRAVAVPVVYFSSLIDLSGLRSIVPVVLHVLHY